jgi:hypothetical protein
MTHARMIRAPPLVRGLDGLTVLPPASNKPVAACQYIYQPIKSIKEPKSTEPQAPSPTSQEKIASLGPRRKRGGKPPKAAKRNKKARLKALEYLWGCGHAAELDVPSSPHPRPRRAPKIKITKR